MTDDTTGLVEAINTATGNVCPGGCWYCRKIAAAARAWLQARMPKGKDDDHGYTRALYDVKNALGLGEKEDRS